MNDNQAKLFDIDGFEGWRKEWEGMPDFRQDDLEAELAVQVNFKSEDDMRAFAKLVGQNLTIQTKSIWWPKQDNVPIFDKLWISEPENKG